MNDPNAVLADSVVDLALKWGVRQIVVCAGARNAPLVLSLLDPIVGVRIWNHFDERSAGFFALGLAKKKRKPTAVVTTSGTAAAELLPAAVEAYYSGIPLVLITADRPRRFRGSGAPQAIEQAGIFGNYVEACLDIDSPADLFSAGSWSGVRPIHLNPCFEESVKSQERLSSPFLGSGAFPERAGDPFHIEAASVAAVENFVRDFSGGLVILGEIDAADRPDVSDFLARLDAPVWAEASSGLREAPDLPVLRSGELVFRAWTPARVLRIGGVPSLRLWRDLEERSETSVLSITRTGFSGLARRSETIEWPDFSRVRVSRSSMSTNSLPQLEPFFGEFPKSEPALIRRLSEKIPSAARIFLGNSLPIREWNLAASFDSPHPDCFSSRGANGIDGEISTFLGLSEGRAESWGIFGDLTTLYDLNAPWIAGQLAEGKRRIVVINNGGGRIFSWLPALKDLPEEAKTITENRHQIHFEEWARTWKWGYRRIGHTAEYDDSKKAHAVIEVLPDPEQTDQFWKAYGAR